MLRYTIRCGRLQQLAVSRLQQLAVDLLAPIMELHGITLEWSDIDGKMVGTSVVEVFEDWPSNCTPEVLEEYKKEATYV